MSPEQIPYPFEFQLLDEDWEHFSVLMESALHRLPVLERTGIRKFYNGPESFTPDNHFILGESPEVAGFFVGAGFNSVGIASAGGAGRALAEWVVAGEPQEDLALVDIRRFAPFHASTPWLRERVSEVLGLHYAVPWPNRELDSARPFRCSPVHDRLAAAGAWFGSKMGWERPNYIAPHGRRPVTSRPPTAGTGSRGTTGSTPSSAPPGRRSPSSTRRRSESCACTGPTPSPCSTSCAPPTSTARSARRSTPGCSTPAVGTRPTSPRRGWPMTSGSSSPAPGHPCATPTGCAGTSHPGGASRSRTSRRPTPCSASWARGHATSSGG